MTALSITGVAREWEGEKRRVGGRVWEKGGGGEGGRVWEEGGKVRRGRVWEKRRVGEEDCGRKGGG